MEPVEYKIARKICELLGMPYPSEDSKQMAIIISEEIDSLIAENKKLRRLENSVDESLNSGDGSYHP